MAIVNTTGGATGQLVGLDGQPLYAVDNDDVGFHEEDDSLLDLSPAELWYGQGSGGEECEGFHSPQKLARPALTVADVFRQFSQEYRSLHGHELTVQQDRVLRELMVCRTEVMGFHRWECDACGAQVELFNSCNNRHCPTCQAQYRRQWAHEIQSCLLPVEYYHVMMTAPRPVTLFALANPKTLYPLMLRAGAEAMLKLARKWKGLKAEIAVLALLHTWGQLMNAHLHTHQLVPGGGLSRDGLRWVSMALGEFLPLDQLQRLFRELFLQELQKLYRSGKLTFPDQWRAIEAPADFEKWLSPLAEINWVIRLRSVWDRTGPEDAEAAARTVEYLARYANRVAISNSRLIAIEGGQVLFRYKDYKDGDQWKTASLPGVEFIGRFLLHVLPQRFRHIRRFGVHGPARGRPEARVDSGALRSEEAGPGR